MMINSKTTLFTVALLAGTAAMAQTKAPEPDYTLAYNVGAVTDYRFRGISQTGFNPAVQGGIDFSHKSGFYLGAFASNVSWVKDFNGATKGNYEVDLYGGYKGSITKDVGFDVGLITYQYLGNNSGAPGTPGAGPLVSNANTNEFYIGLTYGPVTLKMNQSLGDFLGFAGSSGSRYWDLSASFDLGNGFTLVPHIGNQTVNQPLFANAGNYTDYALTLTKDFGNGFSASVAAVGTNANQAFYVNQAAPTGDGQFIGKNGLTVGLKYSF